MTIQASWRRTGVVAWYACMRVLVVVLVRLLPFELLHILFMGFKQGAIRFLLAILINKTCGNTLFKSYGISVFLLHDKFITPLFHDWLAM